jgi:hypothetical protein
LPADVHTEVKLIHSPCSVLGQFLPWS